MKTNVFARFVSMGVLAIGATVVQVSFVNSASAAEAPGNQAIIKVSDLDLSRSADVAKLYRRIHDAAEAACGPEMVTGSYLPRAAQQRCVVEAIDSTIARLHNASLSAYHQQETREQKETRRRGA